MLVGIARGEGVVAGEASLDAGDGLRRERGAARFEVETEAGVAVVEVGAADFLPERELRDQWGDLESQPLASLVRGHAPGPHRKVTVTGAVVSAGDRVVVHGVVLESRFAGGGDGDGGGYRSAARSVPQRVQAVVIGVGSAAEAAIAAHLEQQAERARLADTRLRRQRAAQAEARRDRGLVRRDRVSVVTVVLMLAFVLGLGALGALVRPPRGTLNFGAVAAGALALFGWLLATQAQPALHLADGDDSQSSTTGSVVLTMVLLGVLVLGTLTLINWGQRGKGGKRVEVSHVVFWGWCAMLTFIAVVSWLTTRRFRIIARTLLSAPPLSAAPEDRTWGAVEGAFRPRAGSRLLPVLDTGAALALHVRASKDGTGKHAWSGKVDRLRVESGFEIETPGGVVGCATAQALWCSVAGLERKDTTSKPPTTDTVTLIGTDTRVLVAGRFMAGAGQLAATGTESLLMFAVHEPDDARAVLRRLLRRYWLAMTLVIAALPLHVLLGSWARGWW
ncbi:MAG: hypothetical protein IT370_23195 [Deltaproteobacteria bacterium]|nr:hypothetical protein [Deltaproteobacteria bacterium]